VPQGWTVLFRSDDPGIWNTFSPGPNFAMPVGARHLGIARAPRFRWPGDLGGVCSVLDDGFDAFTGWGFAHKCNVGDRPASAAEVDGWLSSGLDAHTARLLFESGSEFFTNG
jgi:hypothetical protein